MLICGKASKPHSLLGGSFVEFCVYWKKLDLFNRYVVHNSYPFLNFVKMILVGQSGS